ncbi:glycoside hydrolase family 2 protein [Virgisporangium ochraceum]|uniref:beta-mannosidase n=1 Tax=Virgisporangium ochraceum TaxID=65505 RepID=A0A8J4EA80_9ACTN|nr:glycoside hydrolase family 2 protein [Virgisporangium ochraceum]GIJ67451.1 beta-mannosidase [Virgisporangium ochraceum]
MSLQPLAGWTLSVAEGQPGGSPAEARALPAGIAATVPGCVHTDLLAADLIPDPYLDDNENRLQWVGRTDWVYETVFEHTPGGGRTDLVCHGLDTVATVMLNGAEVGTTANMHRSYRFDVTHLLRPGANRLAVRFDSVYRYGDAVMAAVGERPHVMGKEPVPYVRKMACNFGWDWGPTLATAGIWGPIGLETWSVARLVAVRPEVTVVDGGQKEEHSGRVTVRADVKSLSDLGATLTVTLGDHSVALDLEPGATTGTVTLDVPDVDLWWPVGQGAQPLYDLTVALRHDGRDLDRWERRIGFRTVEVDTAPDADGTPFTVKINGRPVFVRGVNWIPDDVFLTRVTRERLAERFGQAVDAGVNLLRVWGGGRYESADFYGLADELGLMVEQDFLFACAAYPEEEPLASEVRAEAAEQVVRLMPHPSLIWWCGNNENLWGYRDWGWAEQLGDRTWGAGYYHDVLPRIVADLDPTRPYWPGSPYAGGDDRHPNEPAHGTTHIWDVWNTDDYRKYREYRPRFVAEFGFQGPPAYATLRRSVSDEPLAADSPGVLHHQKALDGNGKLLRGLAGHLPEPGPGAFDDWHWATQLNQARAVSFGIEHFRSLRPLCMGTIVWQLNDCWPVTSWAAVDGDGRRKPLWYALRRSYADRLITFQPQPGDGLAVVLVNDGVAPWSAHFDVRRCGFGGETLARFSVEVEVEPGGTHRVPLPDDVRTPADPAAELVVADAGVGRSTWYFAEDVDLAYPVPEYSTTVVEADGGLRVEVAAATLLRDLTLFPDRLDPAATVDTALATLLPGERAVFEVRCARPIDRDAIGRPPVLRCANDLGAPTGERGRALSS